MSTPRRIPVPPAEAVIARRPSSRDERRDPAQAARLRFWQKQLADAPALLELPTDHPRPTVRRLGSGTVDSTLTKATNATLYELARRHPTPPFELLLAVFAIVLGRASGQRDLCIGSRTPDAPGEEALALRVRPEPSLSFAAFLDAVASSISQAIAHREPLSHLLAELAPAVSPGHHPLFQVGFAVIQDPEAPTAPPATDHLDLELVCHLAAEQPWRFELRFSRDLFTPTTAKRLLRHFTTLLDELPTIGEGRFDELPMLPAPERQLLVREWNDTANASDLETTVPQRFVEQAARQPHLLALADEKGQLSYGQLAAESEQLALVLRQELGVGPEQLVAVCLESSAAMVVALLAAWRAGGAYLPLDPGHPADRLRGTIEDAGATVVLTRDGLRDKLDSPAPLTGCTLVSLDDRSAPKAARSALPRSSAEHLAYVIYTSGSTGKPKGTLLAHRGLSHLVRWHQRAYAVTAADRATQVASPAFDASVWELWPYLTTGASLFFPSVETRLSPAALYAWLADEAITCSFLPTPLAVMMLRQPRPNTLALKALLIGGDKLQQAPDEELPFRLVNHYGPTEVTVVTTCGDVAPGADSPPIGRPIDRLRTDVLDRRLRPVAIGVPGELTIAGVGLARGYLGRPALSAERFVPDPVASDGAPGARRYLSGDLVRHLPGGELEFLGRLDHQVKVRGFRIELGEIESQLLAEPRVADAVVVTWRPQAQDGEGQVSTGDVRLVAYWVAKDPSAAPSDDALRSVLARDLPEYMVPSSFVRLAELPLSPNGKTDRKALSQLAPPAETSGEEARPRSPLEEEVMAIFVAVLGVERLGIHDSFFALGGHSLVAAQVLTRVRASFGVEPPFSAFFATPTVAGLAEHLAGILHGERAPLPELRHDPTAELEPSFAQERLWFLDQLLEQRETYNIPWPLCLVGRLDHAALGAALSALIARQAVLRTRFRTVEGRPRLDERRAVESALPLVDLSRLADPSPEARRWRRDDANRPFALDREAPIRAVLLRLAPREHQLLLTVHHIATDGWSMAVIGRELSALYRAARDRRPAALPQLGVQYADYARWQRQWLAEPSHDGGEESILASDLGYWRQQLDGVPEVLELPTDRPRGSTMSYRGGRTTRTLPRKVLDGLRGLAQESGSTLFMVLATALATLLARASGQLDLTIGTPVAGRRRVELEALIGFFVNTLVLRGRLRPGESWPQLLARTRQTVLAAIAHQDIPFERLVEELRPEPNLAISPFFQVMLTHQDAPPILPELPELTVELLANELTVAKFDLSLACQATAEGLACELVYNRDLFDATTARRWLLHFTRLLTAIAQDAAQDASALHRASPALELPLLSDAERQQLAIEGCDSAAVFSGPETLPEAFAAQATARAEAVAVIYDDAALSYGQLAARSRRLAAHLRELGVGPEVLVGLAVERSLEMIIGLLGVLGAGGAYVPIDPSYPRDLQRLMIEDALGADDAIVLTRDALRGALPDGPRYLSLDALPAVREERASWPPPRPENLIYAIYTSGSTGRPKGAMNTQRGVLNRLRWMQAACRLGADERVLHKAPFSFDVSVWEIFWPLSAGGQLVIAKPEGHRDSAYLARLVAETRVGTLQLVPSMLQLFVEERDFAGCRALERLVSSGEALSRELQDRFFARAPKNVALYNVYGPTETAIGVLCAVCRPGEGVHLGRPIANNQLFVLDRQLSLVALGTPGQLFIGGVQVGRGYLRRPALTATAFLPDPLAEDPGTRLYATGDLARWRRDGTFEYLGRLDHQVKIRGLRIELGEISSRLLLQPGVRDAAVIVHRSTAGAARLLAYAVPRDAAELDAQALRRALAATLPEFMVPAAITVLSALPTTPSGKLDRRALPIPSSLDELGETTHVMPRTPTEELLAGIFSELLGISGLGIDADFFALGGHSLLAARLIARIRDALGAELPLLAVFSQPALGELARAIDEARKTSAATPAVETITPLASDEEPPLSFAQERLWFLDQLLDEKATYNVPLPLALDGPLDVAALELALNEIIRCHQTLRTSFPAVDGRPRLRIAAPVRRPLAIVDLSGLPPAERQITATRLEREAARRPFELETGPLMRFALIRVAPEKHQFLLLVHHIVYDGWSSDVLWRELATAYQNRTALPAPAIQYADYAAWQRRFLGGETLERQLDFWRRNLSGAPVFLELPTDRPRPPVQGHHGFRRFRGLPLELATTLGERAREANVTLFMFLIAAFKVLLARHAGQNDLTVGTPVAGRRHVETEGLIGCFVNTLVLRSRVRSSDRPDELFAQVRATVLAAFDHQDLPFEKLALEVQPERSLSHTPLFQVMFLLDKARAASPELTGLSVHPLDTAGETTMFDLTLALSETPSGLRCLMEVDRELFDPTTIDRLLLRWQVLLESLVAHPDRRLGEMALLTTAEHHQLLAEWTAEDDLENSVEIDVESEMGLDQACARQAARTPDRIALIATSQAGAESSLSYRELAARAAFLAERLMACGVGPETPVGVCAGRSGNMVAALWGVLAAGGAYVALDPAYPEARLTMMLEDAYHDQPRPVLISERRWQERLPVGILERAEVIWLDELEGAVSTPASAERVSGSLQRLAYVLYTSGSTGRPKGVAIAHGGPLALIRWAAKAYSARQLSAVVAATSINFDLSVFELFVPLATGGTAILVEHALALAEMKGRGDFAAIGRASLLNTVPSAAAELLRLGALPPSLLTLNLAGEPLRQDLVRALYAQTGLERVVDLYGPSEDTTYSTWAERRPEGRETIGRTLAGSRAYVVDAQLRPVPLGVVGELCLAGSGLARGYLGRGALTAEKFVPEIFGWHHLEGSQGGQKTFGWHLEGRYLEGSQGGQKTFGWHLGGRMYRTGDLVRFFADGQLQFLGRRDHQVKVRGFRIELGEIETQLARHPAVREAVALADAGRIFAFLIPSAAEPLAEGEVRRHLGNVLPEYMVPQVLIVRQDFPRLPNGKVDRRQLLTLTHGVGELEGPYVAPRGEVEELLAEIFADLLNVDRVSVEDSFFALGGHSLLATQLLSRLRSTFGVELELRVLFAQPTVARLATVIEQTLLAGRDGELPPLGPRPPGEDAPLSFAQERLWFLDQLEPQNPAYNIPAAQALRGRLDVAALAASCDEIVRRHQVLRTRFANSGGRAVQELMPWRPGVVPLVDLEALNAEQRHREALRCQRTEADRPFDLGRDLLLRAVLVRLDGETYRLLLTTHHIASDGWSFGVLLRELAALYEATTTGQASPLPELPIQVADHAAWQRRWLVDEVLSEQIDYWRQQLAGADAALDLPTDQPRRARRNQRAGSLRQILSPAASQDLRSLARGQEATPFMVLAAVLGALLARLSGKSELCLGTPIAGRGRRETEGLIGLFLNTLVLRLAARGALSFRQLIAQARETALAAYAHQDVPFERLLAELQPERDLSRTPYFQVFLNVLSFPLEIERLGELTVEDVTGSARHAKFDWTLYVQPGEDAFALEWVYDAELFSAARMAEVTRQFAGLLDQAIALPDVPSRQLTLLTPEARALLVDPTAELTAPWTGGAHEHFARRAAAHPARLAVQDDHEKWTYGELEEQSRQLAGDLIAAGLGRGDVVAIYAHRSAALVWGMLGVMRSGAAFVMLDPSYPAARLIDVLELARPRAFLRVAGAGEVEAEVTAFLDRLDCGPRWTLSPREDGGKATASPADELPTVYSQDAAYLAFTSGSTGKPKGIRGHHGALGTFVPVVAEALGYGVDDRFSMLSALAHDPLHRDLFSALLTGAALLLPDQERLGEPGYLAAWMQEQAISVAHLTPALAQLLSERPTDRELLLLDKLRYVILLGDALRRRDIERLLALAPQVVCVNSYGSTETSRGVSYHRVVSEDLKGPAVLPLGQGLADVQILVLDAARQLAGIGELGEIVVRSPHLTLGYLDAASTAERFVPHLVSNAERRDAPGGDRIYTTGDLGRFLPNGEVAHVGRADQQVKIRGFRIELGEIEAALARHETVRQVAVLAIDSSGRRAQSVLVAFVVTADEPPTARELRAFTAAQLPDYMVPTEVLFLDALPLTPNRKLDRAALRLLGLQHVNPEEPRTAMPPRTHVEVVLASIWCELLGVESVGVNDNFFELGGHSLHATRHMYRLVELLEIDLPVRALFEAQTLGELAGLVEEALLAAIESLDDDTARHQVEALGGEPTSDPDDLAVAVEASALTARKARLSSWQSALLQARLRAALTRASGRGIPRRPDPAAPAPLSWFQEMFYMIEQQAQEKSVHVMATAMVLRGPLDVPALCAAARALGERHEILRTRIGIDDEGLTFQQVAELELDLPVVDLVHLGGEKRSERAHQAIDQLRGIRFELAEAPLLRSLLVRRAEDEHDLTFIMPHIISDMWSLGILQRDLAALYNAELAGGPARLPELTIQFADYAVWERDRFQGELLDKLLAYWGEKLSGSLPQLHLETDRPRPVKPRFRGKVEVLTLPPELAKALGRRARSAEASLFMTLLAGFKILLSRHVADPRRVLVATPVGNRTRMQVEQLIGSFASMVMLLTDLSGDPTLGEILDRVRETTLGAFAHQEMPFFLLLANFPPNDFNYDRSPFQVSFTLHNAPRTALDFKELTVASGDGIDRGTADLDLALAAVEAEDGLHLVLRYDQDLFTRTTIQSLLDELRNILQLLAVKPETKLSERLI